ncbi:MAG: murein L,D-transpeptidase catalytic domain family protein [Sphingomicrobium sp.]
MIVSRRDMLRMSACGAAGAALSTAAAAQVFPSLIAGPAGTASTPLPPLHPVLVQAPGGIDPRLLAKAKAALDQHKIAARDWIGVVDFNKASHEERFHVVDLRSGEVESFRVAHGSGSDPQHSGYLDRFSNDFGSYATSNGAYTTGEYYHGKYGVSMKTHGRDWSNYHAEPRAIVIHNAWYAEPDMIAQHGKLGRSQGCFAFSRADQDRVMRKLAGGRLIYADKLA